MRQQEHNNKQERAESGPNYVELIIACIALAPELLLHDPRTFGTRSVAPRAAGTVLAMTLFASSYSYDNRAPLFALAALVALLSIVARIASVVRESRGELCHSRYNGRPWAMAIIPMSEARMKRTEPLLLVISGWGLHHLNHPIGSFVITAGCCHGFRVLVEYLLTRKRTLDFNDALAEQTIAMQVMNRMRRRR